MNVSASKPRLVAWTRVLIAIGWFACIVALGLIIIVDVETVLATGPILFLIGLASIVTGLLANYRRAAIVGASYAGVSLLFFLLVNIFEWSPAQAKWPFIFMGAAFNVFIVPLFRYAWKCPPARPPNECAHCGYLLYGLTEPRCPECGTAFPPEKLALMKPPA